MQMTKTRLGFAAALAGVLAVAGCKRGDREERRAEQTTTAPRAGEPAQTAQGSPQQQPGVYGQQGAGTQPGSEQAGGAQPGTQQQGEQQAMGSQQPGQQPSDQAAGGQQAMSGQAGTGQEQTAEGALIRASDEEIVLRQEGAQEGELRLKVSDSTPVTIDGREGKISDLKEGTQVRASFEDMAGERTATRIEAQEKQESK